jgi:cytochrome P450
VQQALLRGERLLSLFNTTDEAFHAQLRRCVNHAFSMSALVQYEASVDTMTAQFLDQTAALFARTGRTADFALWLQYYSFDVIGHVTNSKPFGFVERNEDVDGIVEKLSGMFNYISPVSASL